MFDYKIWCHALSRLEQSKIESIVFCRKDCKWEIPIVFPFQVVTAAGRKKKNQITEISHGHL